MRPTLRLLLLLAFMPGLIACITVQSETAVTPQPVPTQLFGARWPSPPVRYCIVEQRNTGFVEHERLVQLTQAAFEVWGVATEFDGACPGMLREANGTNEIGWGDLDDGNNILNEAGSTQIRYRRSLSGPPAIVEADIVIDRDPPGDQRSEECLYTTLLHETGHFLGVQHQSTDAIMSPIIRDCAQELTRVDREAIQDLY